MSTLLQPTLGARNLTDRTLVLERVFAGGRTDGSIVSRVEVGGDAGEAECVVAGEECGGAECGEAEGAGEGFAKVVEFLLEGETCLDWVVEVHAVVV